MPKAHQREQGFALHGYLLDVGMPAELGEATDDVVLDFRSGIDTAHDEPLIREFFPGYLLVGSERVTLWKCNNYAFVPEPFHFATRRQRHPGHDREVERECAYARHVLPRRPFDHLEFEIGMRFAEAEQQLPCKAGCDRRNDSDAKPSLLSTSVESCGPLQQIDLGQDLPTALEDAVAGYRGLDPAACSIEKRDANGIL